MKRFHPRVVGWRLEVKIEVQHLLCSVTWCLLMTVAQNGLLLTGSKEEGCSTGNGTDNRDAEDQQFHPAFSATIGFREWRCFCR